MSTEIARVNLRLKKTFAIAKGSAEIKTNVLIIRDGKHCGEASGSVAYGPFADELESEIESACPIISDLRYDSLDDLQTINSLQMIPAAKAALMGMTVNAVSAHLQKQPWELLGLPYPDNVQTTVTFALDDPSTTVKQIAESAYPIVKVKMGNANDAELIKTLVSVRDKEIRVDANGGWSLEQAEEMIARLVRIGVRVIEQPTSPEFVSAWPNLKAKHPQAELFMDEGMGTVEDFTRVGQYCDGINIKMAKCGGTVEGIRLVKAAREAGKKVMLGCMVESTIGIAQAAYMASLADYWDLDGPLLLDSDIAGGLSYVVEKLNLDQDMIGGPKLYANVAQKQNVR